MLSVCDRPSPSHSLPLAASSWPTCTSRHHLTGDWVASLLRGVQIDKVGEAGGLATDGALGRDVGTFLSSWPLGTHSVFRVAGFAEERPLDK